MTFTLAAGRPQRWVVCATLLCLTVVNGLVPTDLLWSHTVSMTNVKPHIRNSHVGNRELEKYKREIQWAKPRDVSAENMGGMLRCWCYDERWVLWQTSIFLHETCVVSLTNTSYHQKGSIDQAQSLTQFSFLLLFHNCKSQPIVSWKCDKQQNLGWLSATGLLAKPLTDKAETKKCNEL